MSDANRMILASRSPRRRELLAFLMPPERIEVMPPASADELDFNDVEGISAIKQRLEEIAQGKNADVRGQLSAARRTDYAAVLSADTVIVSDDADGGPIVLGQPPEENWKAVVRDWFENLLLDRTHCALTAIVLSTPDDRVRKDVVETRVTFHDAASTQIDWYLATGEPRGKAGGYAIQGAGSLFVESVQGSLSNVVGLPLEAVLARMQELGVDDC
ncbi:MAG: septum formation inhibitor Maf [Planctomycetaceae bacterium]|nr:septum formation inhibitor Maf [Planctomycetaceae bacterium]